MGIMENQMENKMEDELVTVLEPVNSSMGSARFRLWCQRRQSGGLYGREYPNIIYRGYVGIIFPYSPTKNQ